MDINEIHLINQLLTKQSDLADRYYKARLEASEASFKFKIILSSHMSTLRLRRKNAGIEMMELMLIEEGYLEEPQRGEVIEYYRTYQTKTDEYKALEKVMEANQTRIMFAQSVMKWQRQGEDFGTT